MTTVDDQVLSPVVAQSRGASAARLRGGTIAIFLLLHVTLAFLMSKSSMVGLLHAWGTLLLGLSWAFSRRPASSVGYVVAYIAGSEVLWRMTGTPVFWEFGKYAAILVLVAASRRIRPVRDARRLCFCFLLLLPSALLTVANSSIDRIHHELSFNLSGPLALAACGAFFASVEFTPRQLQKTLVAALAPIISIWSLVIVRLANTKALHFSTESSFETSGGFGPNQVSSTLGFGALAAMLFLLLMARGKRHSFLRWSMLFLAVVMLAQSALTFSRSGIYLTGASALMAVMFVLRQPRARAVILTSAVFLFVSGNYFLIPWLDNFTGGKIAERFRDTGLTGRDRIMKADLNIWKENPLLGVGPGMATEQRKRFYKSAAAHTELTRLLAEHGVLGFAALWILISVSWHRIRADHGVSRSLAAALVTFSVCYMLTTGMRTVLPCFAFGLALARSRE